MLSGVLSLAGLVHTIWLFMNARGRNPSSPAVSVMQFDRHAPVEALSGLPETRAMSRNPFRL